MLELLKCPNCAGPVEQDAARCEYCGYPFKKQSSLDPEPVDPIEVGRFFMEVHSSIQNQMRHGLLETARAIWNGSTDRQLNRITDVLWIILVVLVAVGSYETGILFQVLRIFGLMR